MPRSYFILSLICHWMSLIDHYSNHYTSYAFTCAILKRGIIFSRFILTTILRFKSVDPLYFSFFSKCFFHFLGLAIHLVGEFFARPQLFLEGKSLRKHDVWPSILRAVTAKARKLERFRDQSVSLCTIRRTRCIQPFSVSFFSFLSAWYFSNFRREMYNITSVAESRTDLRIDVFFFDQPNCAMKCLQEFFPPDFQFLSDSVGQLVFQRWYPNANTPLSTFSFPLSLSGTSVHFSRLFR